MIHHPPTRVHHRAAAATVNIADDPPVVSIAATKPNERGGAALKAVTLTRSGATPVALTVTHHWRTAPRCDYTGLHQLQFPAAHLRDVAINVLQDNWREH